MKTVEAQFAERARPARWLWILPIAGIAVSALLVLAGWRDRVASEASQRRLVGMHQESDAPAASTAHGQVPVYGASARQFLGERTPLWPQALAAIEQAQTNGVSVTGVDWDDGGRGIRVDLQARDHPTALAWLDKLRSGSRESDRAALQWALVRSAEAAAQGVSAQVVGAVGPPAR